MAAVNALERRLGPADTSQCVTLIDLRFLRTRLHAIRTEELWESTGPCYCESHRPDSLCRPWFRAPTGPKQAPAKTKML